MKLGVPWGLPFFRNSFAKNPAFWIFWVMAKSIIFVSPMELTRMLSGFTSPCAHSKSCRRESVFVRALAMASFSS